MFRRLVRSCTPATVNRVRRPVIAATRQQFFATAGSGSGGGMLVFDKPMKAAQRSGSAVRALERAVAASGGTLTLPIPGIARAAGGEYDYLRDEVADRMVDRITDIARAFPRAADIGCGALHIARALARATTKPGATTATAAATAATAGGGAALAAGTVSTVKSTNGVPGSIASLLSIDSTQPLIERARILSATAQPKHDLVFRHELALAEADERLIHAKPAPSPAAAAAAARGGEWTTAVPFGSPILPGNGQYDLITSSLHLHWINDLPSLLTTARKALRPDGCFLGCLLGGATLQELRSSLAVADMERRGGVTAHVSPFAHMRDCGDLLTRAGFALPTVDNDILTVRYPDLFTLCEHLQGMAENNAVLSRAPFVPKDVFMAAAAAYHELYADEDGLIPATFQVIYMIGWAPHESQSKPLARGSATHHISALDTKLTK